MAEPVPSVTTYHLIALSDRDYRQLLEILGREPEVTGRLRELIETEEEA